MEALHTAIRRGKLAEVRSVVDEQRHKEALHYIEAADEYGYTAMHVASRYCPRRHQDDIVQYLVQTCGALVEATTHEGMTPLLLACQAGQIAIVKYLVEVAGASLNATTPDGSTVLHVAFGLDVVQYLVASGANVVATNNEGCRPFHVVCRRNASDIARYLGSANAVAIDNYGRTALHHACHRDNSLDLLRYLVQMGDVNVAAVDATGVTALHVASRHSDLQAVRYLVQLDASLVTAVTQDGMTALHLACRYNTLDTVQYLVDCLHGDSSSDNNSDINTYIEATNGDDGYTALHCACQRRSHAAVAVLIVQFLVEACGANVTATTSDGTTALHLACSDTYNVSLVQYLAERENFNVAALNHKGESALHMASRHGDLAMVRYLIETCGANVVDVTLNGSTMLHMACRNQIHGNELVRYLAKRDCVNVKALNQDGESALHIAFLHGSLKMVRYLIETCHANVAGVTRNGSTMLHFACQNERYTSYDLVRYLAEEYGCLDGDDGGGLTFHCTAATTREGWTVWHYACQRRSQAYPLVQYFVQMQQDSGNNVGSAKYSGRVTTKARDGSTLLHCICQSDSKQSEKMELVQYLLDNDSMYDSLAGAKSLITAVNVNGEVAWDVACRKGHVRLVLYMVQRWKV